jgi:ribosomal protein L17
MAIRKSAQQVAAREKARQKAAEFTARNEQLIELAAKFIEFDDAAEGTETAAREKAEKIIEQGKADAEAARRDAGQIVVRMIETGESKSAVAARLGLTPATMKKYLPAPAEDTTTAAPKTIILAS